MKNQLPPDISVVIWRAHVWAERIDVRGKEVTVNVSTDMRLLSGESINDLASTVRLTAPLIPVSKPKHFREAHSA